MATLSTNLKTLMSLSEINASELARRTGIAQPIIHRISTGQNINPKLATVKPLSEYFMVTVSQLIGEEPLPADQSFYRVNKLHRGWTRVPLVTWEDAVQWPRSQLTYEESEETTYISTDANVSKQSYGLRIKGSAMEPLLPEGTTIIVEPQREAVDRDFIVVHLHNEPTTRLRQLLVDGHDRYLKSLNPDLDGVKVVRLSPQDHIVGVMVQARVDY